MTDPLRERLEAPVTLHDYLRSGPLMQTEDGRWYRCVPQDVAEAALRVVPAGEPLTQADVEPVWTAAFDTDDWTHIVAFANAVRRLEPASAAALDGTETP